MLRGRVAQWFQTLRLAALMLLGAAFGAGPAVWTDSYAAMVERQFHGVMVGMFVGLLVEVVLREILPVRDVRWVEFNRRTVAIVFGYAAIWVGVIVYRMWK